MPSVTRVECSRIEKNTQPQKQFVYTLSLHWSDGSVTEVEKPHSAFVELRGALKKKYGTRRDVHIPEVPSVKKFEIGTASKKDERKKKSVEEFCQQLLQLAMNPEMKGEPVMEFFSSRSLDDDGAYSSAELMDIGSKESKEKSSREKKIGLQEKRKQKQNNDVLGKEQGCLQNKDEAPPPADLGTLYSEVNKLKPNLASKGSKGMQYIEVDVENIADREGSSTVQLPTDGLYAEIGPSKLPTAHQKSLPSQPAKSQNGMNNPVNNIPQYSSVDTRVKVDNVSSSQVAPEVDKGDLMPSKLKTKQQQTGEAKVKRTDLGAEYQNFPITSNLNSDEQRFFVVTKSFMPSTACSQYLAVENGDIVEVKAVSGDQFFCTLHTTHSRPLEGWLPKNILKPCQSNRDGEQEPFLPLSTIPPKPLPGLPQREHQADTPTSAANTTTGTRVIAVTDYSSQDESVLSFDKGLVADLVSNADPHWWCIKVGLVCGWVPADHWQILPDETGSISSTKSKITDYPFFVGSLSRTECEEKLLQHGKQLNFILRESSNLVGQFALSVLHNDHVHHFPIVLTEDNKYYIGKHRFKTIDNVIMYYQRNDLFVDEDGTAVRLGNPLIVQSIKGNQLLETDA